MYKSTARNILLTRTRSLGYHIFDVYLAILKGIAVENDSLSLFVNTDACSLVLARCIPQSCVANSDVLRFSPNIAEIIDTHAKPPRRGTRHRKALSVGETNACDATSGRSQCEPYRKVVEDKLQGGLPRQRIYQDLRDEYGFEGSYYSVRRFVRRLGQDRPIPFRRMECMPGDESQIDFGADVVRPDGKRKRPHVFRIVLSFSQKGYSEAIYHQSTDTFIRCLENAFWHFGGVPRTLIIDNLKAAVPHPTLAFCPRKLDGRS